MIAKWDGTNSVMINHEHDQRLKNRMGYLEERGHECEACGEDKVFAKRICKAHGDKPTSYCFETGGPGCLWKRTGNCLGVNIIEACQDCGKIQGGE